MDAKERERLTAARRIVEVIANDDTAEAVEQTYLAATAGGPIDGDLLERLWAARRQVQAMPEALRRKAILDLYRRCE
jgi:hypothetical protein